MCTLCPCSRAKSVSLVKDDPNYGPTKKAIEDFNNGKFRKNSIQYRVFLMDASTLFQMDDFYTILSIEKLIEYINHLGLMTIEESQTFVQQIIFTSQDPEETKFKLKEVLPNIRIARQNTETKQTEYLSPGCSKELFTIVVKSQYPTSYGTFSTDDLIDFSSQEVEQLKNQQLEDSIDSFPNINHSAEAGILIQKNPIYQFWERKVKEDSLPFMVFDSTPKKPLKWISNIHQATLEGNLNSFNYNLFLLPCLLQLPDLEGNYPAHFASLGGHYKLIPYMHELGASFEMENDEGIFPIHVAKDDKTIEALNNIGCSISVRNKGGESILEIKSKTFDKSSIEVLLKLGYNILIPNSKGIYWMQFVLHNNYFPDANNPYLHFQEFVRKIIKKADYIIYTENQTYFGTKIKQL